MPNKIIIINQYDKTQEKNIEYQTVVNVIIPAMYFSALNNTDAGNFQDLCSIRLATAWQSIPRE